MRASGMSSLAIRRALDLNEAAATVAGLLAPGCLALGPAPGADSPAPRRSEARGPDAAEVLDAVSRGSGIDHQTLVAPGQRRPAVRARHLVMYLVRELCPETSLAAIGFMLDRDHTTVLYGCRRAEVLLRRDRAFREAYLRTRRELTPRRGRTSRRELTQDIPEAGSRG
jgi:hypothetical protein